MKPAVTQVARRRRSAASLTVFHRNVLLVSVIALLMAVPLHAREKNHMTYGEGLIMVAQESPESPRRWKAAMRSPKTLNGATTQSIMFFVDDADAHCANARARGAQIIEEPATHDYGEDYWSDRSYGALDPEGHLWWVTQRLRNPS